MEKNMIGSIHYKITSNSQNSLIKTSHCSISAFYLLLSFLVRGKAKTKARYNLSKYELKESKAVKFCTTFEPTWAHVRTSCSKQSSCAYSFERGALRVQLDFAV